MLTPDSFYDGGILTLSTLDISKVSKSFEFLKHADIIDIGCRIKSRPGFASTSSPWMMN